MIKRILKESIKTITTPLQMLRCHIAAKRYLKHHSIHCLNLGCGENINREWFNTDITFAIYGKHYYMNATKRYPFPDKSIDYIFSEHMFEHLKLTEAVKMLKECRRVLKKNGVLRITLPCFEFLHGVGASVVNALSKWLEVKVCRGGKVHYQKYEYGKVVEPLTVIGDCNPDFTGTEVKFLPDDTIFEDTVYDYKTLEMLLHKYGFTNIKRCQLYESEHRFLTNMEKHDQATYKNLSKIESTVIEASC